MSTIGSTSSTLGILGLVAGGSFPTAGLLEPSGNSDRSTFQTVGWAGLAGGAPLPGLGTALQLASVTHACDAQGARLAKCHDIQLTPEASSSETRVYKGSP